MFKKLLPLLLLVCPCCSKPQIDEPKKPIKVEAAEVMQATIPIFIEAIGHVRASLFAEIKSQVEGRLIGVHYDQAADVQQGALLATIDPSFYQAKLDEAEGVFLETKASLRFAEEKVARYAQLAIDDYVSKLNFDEYVTQREALIASLKKNEGLVKEAKVYLDYCFIKAPFSGRVGKRLVDEGNLIDNSGSTLVTLHQMEPIYVDFSVSEKHLPKLLEKNEGLTVKVQHSGGAVMEEIGRVIALDSSVDPKTGMISLRAEFANRGKKLWPGEFVKVRLILEEKESACIVPEGALNLTQKGYMIYKIESDLTVTKIPVNVGQNLGQVYEIMGPLKKGDKVITYGQFNLTDTSVIDVQKLDNQFYHPQQSW